MGGGVVSLNSVSFIQYSHIIDAYSPAAMLSLLVSFF